MKVNHELITKINNREIIKTDAIGQYKMNKVSFYKMLKQYDYEKIAHGIYAHKDDILNESYVIHAKYPNAIFSHEEALYYYHLLDREPSNHTITIYTGYGTKTMIENNLKVYTVKKELINIGKTTVIDNYGYEIPVYDLERTICDLVRNRKNFEVYELNSILKQYVQLTDKDLNKLMNYATQFRVAKIIYKYLQILI